MKLAARINSNRQYAEDAWEAISHIKEITEKTTIGELIAWQKKLFPRNSDVQAGNIEQIYISNME